MSDDDEFELLPPDESLDSDFLDEDDLEGPGYSPPDRAPAELRWGFTAREAHGHEPLADRLSRELPDIGADDDELGDGIGDIIGTDGEVLDDQVGSARAGRLILSEPGNLDPASDYWATDIGIDGGAAGAEEAAIHIVDDE